VALALLGGCEPPGPSPYGFEHTSKQQFIFEAEEQTDVDGAPVTVQRYAEFRLEAEREDPARTELSLVLDRYYMRVEGAPGGEQEMALSPSGLVFRNPSQGEVRLGADEDGPGGRTVAALLRNAVAGVVVRPDGRLVGDPWRSQDPLLGDFSILEWVVLAFPVLEANAPAWSAGRPLPVLGQYRLGIQLPMQFERLDGESGGTRVRSAGAVQRESLALTAGFRGRLQIDQSGEASLSPAGRLEEARVELRSSFQADDGTNVGAHYRVRLRCADCGHKINPSPLGSDTPKE
jgi:hypothetical protein